MIDYMVGSNTGFGVPPTPTAPSGASDPGSAHDSMALRDHLGGAAAPSLASHFAYQTLRPPFAPLPVPGAEFSRAARAHYATPPVHARAPAGSVASHQGAGHAFSGERFSGHPAHFSSRSKQLLAQTASIRRGLQGLEARRKALNVALGRDPCLPSSGLPAAYRVQDKVPCK